MWIKKESNQSNINSQSFFDLITIWSKIYEYNKNEENWNDMAERRRWCEGGYVELKLGGMPTKGRNNTMDVQQKSIWFLWSIQMSFLFLQI